MGKQYSGDILHFGATRFRVTGSGNLDLFLRSLDDVRNTQLTSIPMVNATNREPTVLANFNEQAAQLELRTDTINEIFTISKIIIYIKPVATGYPQ